jgi:hypothetical protein
MVGDLIKIKMLAIDQVRAWRTVIQDLIIDIGAGINTDWGRLEQPYRPNREKVSRPRPGPNEMNGHFGSFTALHCTMARAGRQP